MLANEKNDLLYLLNLLEAIGKIRAYSVGAADAVLFYELNEQMNLNASLNLLAYIGENVAKISEGLKSEYPEIAWQAIKNFRNKIIHDYLGLDIAIAYEIIRRDLPQLQASVEKIIREKIHNGIFAIGELEVSQASNFYRHIDYDNLRAE
jgi:uncharacterized protein with HEPN domain